jgi:signal transduction histidine kinase
MNGIGLGLVISKLIVGKFNGTIDFLSTYGKGSTFYFTFEVLQFDKKKFILD